MYISLWKDYATCSHVNIDIQGAGGVKERRQRNEARDGRASAIHGKNGQRTVR